MKVEIVVLSMLSASDRRASVNVNLQNSPHPWHFFDALTGPDGTDFSYNEKGSLYRGRHLLAGEIGCYISHVAILKRFIEERRSEWLLVLEDDVYYDVNFPLRDLCGTLSAARVDYIRLFARHPAPFRSVARWGSYHIVRFLKGPFGTQAYLISHAGAERFLKSLTEIVRPIDDELDRFWTNGLPIYSVFPFPAMELYGKSTIERSTGARSKKRTRSIEKTRIAVLEKYNRIISNFYLKRSDKKVKCIAQRS